MKVSYDMKTDFLAIRFESEASTYVDDFGNGVDVVRAEADDRIVGYDLYNARVAILEFKEVTTSQKFAILVKIYRKCSGMTQEDLGRLSNIPLPTIKIIEKGDSETGVENVSRLKRVLPEIDLNSISISKVAS